MLRKYLWIIDKPEKYLDEPEVWSMSRPKWKDEIVGELKIRSLRELKIWSLGDLKIWSLAELKMWNWSDGFYWFLEIQRILPILTRKRRLQTLCSIHFLKWCFEGGGGILRSSRSRYGEVLFQLLFVFVHLIWLYKKGGVQLCFYVL